MVRHAFRSMQEPPPGPYSAAVSAGHLVFVSAQLPLDERGARLQIEAVAVRY
jgi:enamine deaminase RidA (YjgF/YER057c/UK114 family)